MPTLKALVYKAQGAADNTAQIAFTLDGTAPAATLATGTYESVAVSAEVSYEIDAVATLTAGSIDQASPSVGDTLTVSGSNASGSATYQWQERADDSTWSDISGATLASYDTTSLTADQYVRRQVSDGAQGPVSTASVQVTAAAAFTEYAIDFQGTASSENTLDNLATDTRYSLIVASVVVPALDDNAIFSHAGAALSFNGAGLLSFRIIDATGTGNTLTSSTDFVADHPGQRLSILAQTTDDGGTGTRMKVWTKVGSGAWAEEINATRARPEVDFTGPGFAVGGGGATPAYDDVMYGVAVYTDGNIGSSFDIGMPSDRDAFFNSDGTLAAPATGNSLIGNSPKLDTRGLDVAAMNAGTNNGIAPDFDTVGGSYIAG